MKHSLKHLWDEAFMHCKNLYVEASSVFHSFLKFGRDLLVCVYVCEKYQILKVEVLKQMKLLRNLLL